MSQSQVSACLTCFTTVSKNSSLRLSGRLVSSSATSARRRALHAPASREDLKPTRHTRKLSTFQRQEMRFGWADPLCRYSASSAFPMATAAQSGTFQNKYLLPRRLCWRLHGHATFAVVLVLTPSCRLVLTPTRQSSIQLLIQHHAFLLLEGTVPV